MAVAVLTNTPSPLAPGSTTDRAANRCRAHAALVMASDVADG